MKNLSVTKEAGLKWKRQPTPGFLPGKSHARRSLVGYSQSVGSQRVRHNWATSFSLSDRWDKSKSPFWMTKPFLVISMENTFLFLFVAFGDFRNQLELFSSSWECPTLGQEQPGLFFFFCSSPPFDISKRFKYQNWFGCRWRNNKGQTDNPK